MKPPIPVVNKKDSKEPIADSGAGANESQQVAERRSGHQEQQEDQKNEDLEAVEEVKLPQQPK